MILWPGMIFYPTRLVLEYFFLPFQSSDSIVQYQLDDFLPYKVGFRPTFFNLFLELKSNAITNH